MTNKELQELLKKLPDDFQIRIRDESIGLYFPVRKVLNRQNIKCIQIYYDKE
jgi:hypothetical protein